ncbi:MULTISPECIES: hypothetical protein [unclassified Methylobacterium]|jgi:acetyl-CoA acetyltransferase|uniref:hypothetical protein n=1 Tax=unclassified Methylobacterium TaxID=2615210 RepID=UPI001355314D|nr:hypothetical protein [Methylobacterium sp. 2A]MWV24882.1 hypothetical protein [Methylobacterium sp. 2A]
MNFTVSARIAARRFAYQHASILTALDQGMSLIAAGMADVTITDGSGRTRSPASLYQSLFGGGRVDALQAEAIPGVMQAA